MINNDSKNELVTQRTQLLEHLLEKLVGLLPQTPKTIQFLQSQVKKTLYGSLKKNKRGSINEDCSVERLEDFAGD